MRCPKCGCQDDKVVDSRATREGAGVRRRRECLSCYHRFTTHEEIIQAELKVVKRDNTREDFHPEKLRTGIEKACWKRDVRPDDIDRIVAEITTSIETDFDREVSSQEVGRRAMLGLKNLDKVAYVRFASIYRDFQDPAEFITEVRTINKKQS